MRIFTGFKRELVCADRRVCFLMTGVTWFVGSLVLFLSGAWERYVLWEMPRLAPSLTVWLIFWSVHSLLSGFALGVVLGCGECTVKRFRTGGVLCWSLYQLCTLLWIILLYGAVWRLTALLLVLASVCIGLWTLAFFARRSLLSALLLLYCIGWQIFCFLQTLLIILYN